MNDDLQKRLAAWQAPPEPHHATHRIAALLADGSLPGPLVANRRRGVRMVPVICSMAIASLLWVGWRLSADRSPAVLREGLDVPPRTASDTGEPLSVVNRDVARYVSQVDLDGFDVVTTPRLQIDRRTP